MRCPKNTDKTFLPALSLSLIHTLGLFASPLSLHRCSSDDCLYQALFHRYYHLSHPLFYTNQLTEFVLNASDAWKVLFSFHLKTQTVASMCCCLQASAWNVSTLLSELLVTVTDTWGNMKCPSKPWERKTGYRSSSKPPSEEQRDAERKGE